MILTVTLNAVIDHVYQLADTDADAAELALASWHVPAGKGVNVSRALASLGHTSAAVVVSDAASAPLYRQALESIGVTPVLLIARPSVRHHATIVRADGQHVHARELGSPCDSACLSDVLDAVGSLEPGDAVALSGSLPPGLDPSAYAHLVRAARERGAVTWVDCDGLALAEAVSALPDGVKVNGREAGLLLGRQADDAAEAAEAAHRLIDGGVRRACITLGSSGLVLADGSGIVHAWSEPRPAGSSVGCGDTALAALVAADAQGLPQWDAALLAAAASAANVGSPVPGSFTTAQLVAAAGLSGARRLA